MIGGIPKVIFDTNSIRNEGSSEYFLGGREQLDRFRAVAEIYIPEIVIDEIKAQKKKHLSSKKESFLGNIFHKLLGVSEDKTSDFNIDGFIQSLENNESIPYAVIKLTNFSVLLHMKNMAVRNKPPFDSNSDKGFKDAYIFFTVLEFLKSTPDEQVFFITEDERLKDAFSKIGRIRVVEGFEDFQRYRTEYFREEYFVQKLLDEIDKNIEARYVQDAWLNINSNWVVLVDMGLDEYRIEVDFATKEIISWIDRSPTSAIKSFEQSDNFSATHSCIDDLEPFVQYLSNEEVIKIITAAAMNGQIFSIAKDEDVKAFINTLWNGKANILPKEIRDRVQGIYINP